MPDAIHVCPELLSGVECIAKETSDRIIVMRASCSVPDLFTRHTRERLIYSDIIGIVIYIYYTCTHARLSDRPCHSALVIERLLKVYAISHDNHSLRGNPVRSVCLCAIRAGSLAKQNCANFLSRIKKRKKREIKQRPVKFAVF